MTQLLYLDDNALFEASAQVLEKGQHEKGAFLVLDRTPFHPQGGGQPADRGSFFWEGGEVSVSHVEAYGAHILHYVQDARSLPPVGARVLCVINKDWRFQCARYHTAAHLLAHGVEEHVMGARPVRAHAFPGEAVVSFEGDFQDFDVSKLERRLATLIAQNLWVGVARSHGVRFVRIGDFTPTPCGGTHVRMTGEIGKVHLSRVKRKKDRVSLFFEIP